MLPSVDVYSEKQGLIQRYPKNASSGNFLGTSSDKIKRLGYLKPLSIKFLGSSSVG